MVLRQSHFDWTLISNCSANLPWCCSQWPKHSDPWLVTGTYRKGWYKIRESWSWFFACEKGSLITWTVAVILAGPLARLSWWSLPRGVGVVGNMHLLSACPVGHADWTPAPYCLLINSEAGLEAVMGTWHLDSFGWGSICLATPGSACLLPATSKACMALHTLNLHRPFPCTYVCWFWFPLSIYRRCSHITGASVSFVHYVVWCPWGAYWNLTTRLVIFTLLSQWNPGQVSPGWQQQALHCYGLDYGGKGPRARGGGYHPSSGVSLSHRDSTTFSRALPPRGALFHFVSDDFGSSPFPRLRHTSSLLWLMRMQWTLDFNVFDWCHDRLTGGFLLTCVSYWPRLLAIFAYWLCWLWYFVEKNIWVYKWTIMSRGSAGCFTPYFTRCFTSRLSL